MPTIMEVLALVGSALVAILPIILAGFIILVILAFVRALAVRVTTGKWPHQHPEALRIYRDLP